MIRLEPGPAADSLIFVVAGRDGLPVGSGAYGFSVYACGTEQAFWTIAAGGGRSLPSRIAYGQAVPGFATP
ncbi:MAG TPA: hypothetical protein VH277_17740, partial [Gemmatimonadaceae bacterium]|nr:hypothetical protein [Gemmatimonadaceae bacterium]